VPISKPACLQASGVPVGSNTEPQGKSQLEGTPGSWVEPPTLKHGQSRGAQSLNQQKGEAAVLLCHHVTDDASGQAGKM